MIDDLKSGKQSALKLLQKLRPPESAAFRLSLNNKNKPVVVLRSSPVFAIWTHLARLGLATEMLCSKENFETPPDTRSYSITDLGAVAIPELIRIAAHEDYREKSRIRNAHPDFLKAQIFYNGLGVPQNFKEAMKLYLQAAAHGDTVSQHMLGFMYHNGQGVNADYKEAMKWYLLAAEKGDAGGDFGLAAMNQIGRLHELGLGVPLSYKEAEKWYRRSAEHGHSAAQSNLGILFYKGNGVTRDYEAALKWFMKAAEKEEGIALGNIGYMYHQGNGVLQNDVQAYIWYTLAVVEGISKCKNDLDTVRERLNQKQINDADQEVIRWKLTHTIGLSLEDIPPSEADLRDLIAEGKFSHTPNELYPITIVQDRYGGTYSRGQWLAIAQGSKIDEGKEISRVQYCLSDGPHGGDPDAMGFWASEPDWIASGALPEHAMERLIKKLIKPLPELKVVRETYCSQKMTDDLLRGLYENRVDLIARMQDNVRRRNDTELIHVLGYLQTQIPKSVTVPTSRLGWLDLMFELIRRVRTAADMPDSQLVGVPLKVDAVPAEMQSQPAAISLNPIKIGFGRRMANLPQQGKFPFPDIVLKKEGEGVTQAVAEKAIKLLYERRPDILLEISDSIARDMEFFSIKQEYMRFLSGISHELDYPKSKPVGRWRNRMSEETFSYVAGLMGLRAPEGRFNGHYMTVEEADKRIVVAAEKGDAVAQYKMGLGFYDSVNHEKNLPEAVKWFQKSAEQGYFMAQAVLGRCYAKGEGVPQDYVEAYFWLSLAAEVKSTDSKAMQQEVVQHLTPETLASLDVRLKEWAPKRTPRDKL